MDITSPTFQQQQEPSSGANRSAFVLPTNFPFSQPELFKSCRFWPSSSSSSSSEDDDAFLKQVVTPPLTTTIRIVVPLPPSLSATVPDRRQREENNENDDDVENNKILVIPPRQQLVDYAKKFQSILNEKMSTTGSFYDEKMMPEVIFVSPSIKNVASSSSATANATASTTTRPPLHIIVDSGCGEAVLRGGDVYAPGVLASNRSFEKGDVADLVCAMVGSNPSGNISIAGKNAPLVGSYVENFNYFSENTVVVAKNCVIEMSRLECFNGKPRAGLAIKTNGGVFNHPSMTILSDVHDQLKINSSVVSSPQPFLQNVSSLYPAAFLMKKLLDDFHQNKHERQRPLRILDMCAAPGGKSSHLLSRFALTFPSEIASAQNIRLVCVEKSAPRAKQLKKLLDDHHGSKTVDECVLVVAGDANKILKTGTKENEAVTKFFFGNNNINLVPQSSDENSSLLFFDAILLDPPCTGFGLRPRLRTFEVVDRRGVESSADYQRKLLSTAASLVRPGGYISYSTCTTSMQENEMNVAWGVNDQKLKVLPLSEFTSSRSGDVIVESQFLRVAFESKMARATMRFVKNNSNDDNDKSGNSDEIEENFQTFRENDACVLRFGPFSDGLLLSSSLENKKSLTSDSVGFFLAMFQKQ